MHVSKKPRIRTRRIFTVSTMRANGCGAIDIPAIFFFLWTSDAYPALASVSHVPHLISLLAALAPSGRHLGYSHSMVAGGFEEMS